jgi:spore coat protein A
MKSTAGVYLAYSARRLSAAIPGGSLDPASIRKYVSPLSIPDVMPPISTGGGIDQYAVAARQFRQQILPDGSPKTTVFGYGALQDLNSFHYPGPTFEAKSNRPVRVTWVNALVDNLGRYLPHILPVDPTLHWANPSGPPDMRPVFKKTPGPYLGPVPTVTHLHGARVFEDSDGYPEAWYLPPALNIPAGYSRNGTSYDDLKHKFLNRVGVPWLPGTSVYEYDNQQPSGTLWYHDHTIGITRLNVYAGLAGLYMLRGADEDARRAALPPKQFEIPLVIQDRSFNADGSLFFTSSREFFDGFTGPYIPASDIPPIWNPEFFGNTMVVNGNTWPLLKVEPRRYRFRVLNGCNARTVILKISSQPPKAGKISSAALPIWQIGADGGFLPAPAQLQSIVLMPGQRNDVIVDFSGLRTGATLYLINEAADEPYGGGQPGTDFTPSDPDTTGQVMKFQVTSLTSADTTALPVYAGIAAGPTLQAPVTRTRRLSLNEFDSGDGPNPPGPPVLWGPDGNQCSPASNTCVPAGPRGSFLGTVDAKGFPTAYEFMDPVTEHPNLGDTEIWELYNFTADAHPMHVHLVQFQLINRQNLKVGPDGIATAPATLVGRAIDPENWERGPKDTVAAYPGMVTRIKMTFDRAGLYLWHCHILDHEDNDMMRPYRVG